MLDEGSYLDQGKSRRYCEFRYDRYGVFASLPLATAVLETQSYSLEEFKGAISDYSRNSSVAEFIDGLKYDGKDYFTIEESRFLLHINNCWTPVTDEQLEADGKVNHQICGYTHWISTHPHI